VAKTNDAAIHRLPAVCFFTRQLLFLPKFGDFTEKRALNIQQEESSIIIRYIAVAKDGPQNKSELVPW
jgi:hypothetical protein